MKTISLGSTTATLQLWDTAGQERSDLSVIMSSFFFNNFSCFQNFLGLCFPPVRFRSITEQYYRKADGILAMYDLTDVSSFTAVRGWMDSVKVSRAMQNALSHFEYALGINEQQPGVV